MSIRVFASVPSGATFALAAASFTTSSTTITMAAGNSNLGTVLPGMTVHDVTLGITIGTVQSISGTTVTLTGTAAHASQGTTDNLAFFAMPSQVAVPPGIPPAGQRFYQTTIGAMQDIPGDSTGDAAVLNNMVGFTTLFPSGPTSARASRAGAIFIDTSLAIVVAWDGANWRNVVSGAVA